MALVLGAVTVGLQSGWLPGTSEVAPAAPAEAGEGAVPTHIYAVPERLESRGENDAWPDPREDVSAVTRASAGYVTTAGGAVLISARNGVHHRVDLLGFNDRWAGMHEDGPVLAVSPDGRKVAYFWRERVPDDGPRVPSGVRILDLASGEGQEYPLPGGVGVRVNSLGWSPDGGFLVYRAGVLDRIDALGGFTTSGYRLERLDVTTGERTVLPRGIARISGAVAVSNDGTVTVGEGTTLFAWSESQEPPVREQELPADLSGASARCSAGWGATTWWRSGTPRPGPRPPSTCSRCGSARSGRWAWSSAAGLVHRGHRPDVDGPPDRRVRRAPSGSARRPGCGGSAGECWCWWPARRDSPSYAAAPDRRFVALARLGQAPMSLA